MAFHGIRYAVDKENSRQYAIMFTHGKITNVYPVASDPQDQRIMPGEPCNAIDDDFNEGVDEDGQPIKLEYTFVFTNEGRPGKGSSAQAVDPNTPTPSQHPAGADMARSVFQQMESQFDTEGPLTQPPKQTTRPTHKPTTGTKKPTTTTGSGGTTTPTRPIQPPVRLTMEEKRAEQLLTQYGRDLTAMAASGELDPTIGREDEIERSLQILDRRGKASVCLTGEAGVGKTQIFYGTAQKALEDGENKRFFELDLQAMNAGTKFRGEFEKRLKPILDALRSTKGKLGGQDVVLCIDELHSALTAGQAEGGTNAGQIMKPYLAEGSVRAMATTTEDEYKQHIEKDGALSRRFQKLRIDEPTSEDTVQILMKIKGLYEDHADLQEEITEEQIKFIVKMTDRFLPTRHQPDKALSVLDDATSSAKRDPNSGGVLTQEHIVSSLAKESGLKRDFLDQSDAERFVTAKKDLPQVVLGQDESIEQIMDTLIAARAGLGEENQPWGAFLLQGPSGTGKTETAKALAKMLHGSEDALIKLDMSEFSEKHAASGLIGAPPGYVGHDETDGKLTEPVRQKPYSVLLLDEVEKAHKDAFNILLSVLNDGKLTDQKGRLVDFRNTIIIMSSNLGSEELLQHLSGENSMGWGGQSGIKADGTFDADDPAFRDKLKSTAEKARGTFFRPEFLSRLEALGGCLTYMPLSSKTIHKLTDREIDEVGRRIRENPQGMQLENVTLEVSQEVKDELAEKGYSLKYGARPLKGEVKKNIQNPLGMWMLQNKEDLTKKNKEGPVKLVINSFEDAANPKVVAEKAKKKDKKEEVTAEAAEASTPANDDTDTKPKTVKKPAANNRKP